MYRPNQVQTRKKIREQEEVGYQVHFVSTIDQDMEIYPAPHLDNDNVKPDILGELP